MMEPGLSQIVTFAPDGTHARWLSAIGHVNQLVYSYANPGGCDQMSCLVQLPANFRSDALNPGRIVQIRRGGGCVWDGKLQEPVPASTGWTVTAVGTGNAGTDYMATYASAWASSGNQNDAVNQAISRGLRWTNPGGNLSGPPWTSGSIPSGVWFGQEVDNAADTITDLLNLFCTKGGYTWYVSTQHAPDGSQPYYGNNILSVYSFPATTLANVTRILVSAQPVARTLGGDYNRLYLRYQKTADTSAAATYGTTVVDTPASVAQHQSLEAYEDLSSSGVETLGTIQAAGNNVLARYQRASFAGPFTVRYGELLTTGGYPVDLGTDQCGQIVKLVLADYGYGGEVVPDPVIFMVGAYEYDDMAQTAAVTPFQALDTSMSSMLSVLATTLPPEPVPRIPPRKSG
jgi:hypothetical protein